MSLYHLTRVILISPYSVPKSTDRPNIIPLVTTGARFNYLPVSAPQQQLTPRAVKEKSFVASPRVSVTTNAPSTDAPVSFLALHIYILIKMLSGAEQAEQIG